MKRDKRYDYIRVFAMLAIVMCHVFQVLNVTSVALWLNVGVQIFLVLSAKLISGKKFDSGSSVVLFFKSRVLRIFVPVWIYLLFLVPALFVIGKGPSLDGTIMYVLGLAGFAKRGILGLGHFWYITVLIICYCLVPLLYKIAHYCEKMNKVKAIFLKLVIPLAAILAFLFTKYKYFGVNIALFSVAYFWFYEMKSDENWSKDKNKYLIPVSVILILIRLYFDTTTVVENPYYDGLFSTAVKGVIGLTLFIVFYNIFPSQKSNRVIDFISNISYEVYITHQFIILALYDFIPIFKHGFVGGALLCVCSILITFINATILYYINTFVEKRFFKR